MVCAPMASRVGDGDACVGFAVERVVKHGRGRKSVRQVRKAAYLRWEPVGNWRDCCGDLKHERVEG